MKKNIADRQVMAPKTKTNLMSSKKVHEGGSDHPVLVEDVPIF